MFQQELEAIRAEQKQLREALASKEERKGVETRVHIEWDQRFETLVNPEAQITTQDFRDAPPPYEEQLYPVSAIAFLQSLERSAVWAKTKLYRVLRPRLAKGWTRLEWTCVSFPWQTFMY